MRYVLKNQSIAQIFASVLYRKKRALFALTTIFSCALPSTADEVATAKDILLELLPNISRKIEISDRVEFQFDSIFIGATQIVFFTERETNDCISSGCLSIYVIVGPEVSMNKAVIFYSEPIKDYWRFFASQCFHDIAVSLPTCEEKSDG